MSWDEATEAVANVLKKAMYCVVLLGQEVRVHGPGVPVKEVPDVGTVVAHEVSRLRTEGAGFDEWKEARIELSLREGSGVELFSDGGFHEAELLHGEAVMLGDAPVLVVQVVVEVARGRRREAVPEARDVRRGSLVASEDGLSKGSQEVDGEGIESSGANAAPIAVPNLDGQGGVEDARDRWRDVSRVTVSDEEVDESGDGRLMVAVSVGLDGIIALVVHGVGIVCTGMSRVCESFRSCDSLVERKSIGEEGAN